MSTLVRSWWRQENMGCCHQTLLQIIAEIDEIEFETSKEFAEN
jgi:hypothetical protein